MTVRQDEQLLTPSAKIVLYELDATALGGEILYFTPMINENDQPVVWQGKTYTPYPIKAEGFEWSGSGNIPRPNLSASNITGLITALCLTYDDLVGSKVTRKMTLAKYLDASNFPGGNPSADPEAHWPDEIYYVDRKISENKNSAEFELTSSFDMEGVRLPRRFVVQNVCVWKYRSPECSYAGGAVATIDDVPTSDINLDACGKRIASCLLRFGDTATLPFGSFPAVGLVKV